MFSNLNAKLLIKTACTEILWIFHLELTIAWS